MKKNMLQNQALMFDEKALNNTTNLIIWLWFVWSNLAYNLFKTWFKNFILVDYDTVEEKNLLNQIYNTKELVGTKKATALKYILDTESSNLWINNFITKKEEKWEKVIKELLNSQDKIENYNVFITVDNLESRKYMVKLLLKYINKFINTNIFIIWANWDWFLYEHIILWNNYEIDREKVKNYEE